ncbi:MAG: hypothetical protein KJ971_07905 [Firmicutes bacterium]|nr:hypothetical protein [Bacillota bacterium]
MKRIVLGFLLFLLVFTSFLGCQSTRNTAFGDGEITFEIYDQEDVLLSRVTVDYEEGDTLLGLLMENFTVSCQDELGGTDETCSYSGLYGVYLLSVGDLEAYNNGEFIEFYINDEYALSGIDTTDIIDGSVYQFKYGTYEIG